MKRNNTSRKRPAKRYRVVRALARLLFLLLLLLAAVFAYVSTLGIPQPMLQKVLEKANGAGIPIGIGRIRYAFASLDLKMDGATVVEIPPGMYGDANDANFKYLTDFGPTGPDKGEGGKYLFLPPGYEGKEPRGYHVFRSPG